MQSSYSDGMRAWLTRTPTMARVAPFLIFLVLTSCQGQLGEASRYWLYALKTVLGAWMLWAVRPVVAEVRWSFGWQPVAAGIAVFVLWVGLDPLYPKFGDAGKPWNPLQDLKHQPLLAWGAVGCRILGSSLVVPTLEETFYRSFLYRSIQTADFLSVPLGRLNLMAVGIGSLVFGFAHHEWLAGILCGVIYQGLAVRKGHLGDAITAHAITNFLLGLWVVFKGDWHFW